MWKYIIFFGLLTFPQISKSEQTDLDKIREFVFSLYESTTPYDFLEATDYLRLRDAHLNARNHPAFLRESQIEKLRGWQWDRGSVSSNMWALHNFDNIENLAKDGYLFSATEIDFIGLDWLDDVFQSPCADISHRHKENVNGLTKHYLEVIFAACERKPSVFYKEGLTEKMAELNRGLFELSMRGEKFIGFSLRQELLEVGNASGGLVLFYMNEGMFWGDPPDTNAIMTAITFHNNSLGTLYSPSVVCEHTTAPFPTKPLEWIVATIGRTPMRIPLVVTDKLTDNSASLACSIFFTRKRYDEDTKQLTETTENGHIPATLQKGNQWSRASEVRVCYVPRDLFVLGEKRILGCDGVLARF